MRTDVENEGAGKLIRIEVGLPAFVYSRLALFAKRHEQTLGEEIRAALRTYVEQQQAKAAEALGYAERTISDAKSSESG
jgi:metal-responsive CopG/Arc/MetJ family transcriptional regulator